jgi:hypothetical protein
MIPLPRDARDPEINILWRPAISLLTNHHQ